MADSVLGVDGCPGGWVGALVTGRVVEWLLLPDAATMVAVPAAARLVDMPIGLPDRQPRGCDVAARALLGPRRSSVFPAPPRAVLAAADYADARRLAVAATGRSMSVQAWGLVWRIADVDAVLERAPDDALVECHPEVAFRLMAGTGLEPKKTATGRDQRLAALATWLPEVAAAVARRPRVARVDDALDALACAWSAQRWLRGDATVLPAGAVPRDAAGRPMRIVA